MTRWEVALRGVRKDGIGFNLQLRVEADNPLAAVDIAMQAWGLTRQELTKVHVQVEREELARP